MAQTCEYFKNWPLARVVAEMAGVGPGLTQSLVFNSRQKFRIGSSYEQQYRRWGRVQVQASNSSDSNLRTALHTNRPLAKC